MKTFDCHGDFPSLHAYLFRVQIDDEYETVIGINMGLTEIQLLISGRFRAKKIEVLLEYGEII